MVHYSKPSGRGRVGGWTVASLVTCLLPLPNAACFAASPSLYLRDTCIKITFALLFSANPSILWAILKKKNPTVDSVGISRYFAREERLKFQNNFGGVQKSSGSRASLPSLLQELHGGNPLAPSL